MRSFLVSLGLLAALATAGVALLVFRGEPPLPAPEEAPGAGPADPAAARAPRLRPYQTTLTLMEDLRDALPLTGAEREAELWRVSEALEGQALWTLENLAPEEGSPKVRALLVLAAGVHAPEDGAVQRFLGDGESVVRRAAVLAMGYRSGGLRRIPLLEVGVPVGRTLSPAAKERLVRQAEREEDGEVRRAIALVLSSPR